MVCACAGACMCVRAGVCACVCARVCARRCVCKCVGVCVLDLKFISPIQDARVVLVIIPRG